MKRLPVAGEAGCNGNGEAIQSKVKHKGSAEGSSGISTDQPTFSGRRNLV